MREDDPRKHSPEKHEQRMYHSINPLKMQLIPYYPIHRVEESNRNESIIDIILNLTNLNKQEIYEKNTIY